MNIELNRLETFTGWPSDSIIAANRLAKAGFFYLKEGQKVECFACHCQISEWNYGDQVMARHRSVSPQCPFVLHPTTSSNVPIATLEMLASSSTNLRCEDVRLSSFENWPIQNIVSAAAVAQAGFFYTKEGDITQCAFCNGIVSSWEAGDDPELEHIRHFPHCSFVQTVIKPRINAGSSRSRRTCNNEIQLDLSNNKHLDDLGVTTHTGPKRSEYATVTSRLKTFATWPSELIQTPDILSEAGFFYEGVGDLVRCFHCDGGLKDWNPHDDPWTEHAKWFPRCSFVKLAKGQEFINACGPNCIGNPVPNEVYEKPPRQQPRRREVTERELQDHMTSSIAMAALNIGLNVERVKRAIREKLEQTGQPYSRADNLVEAALNLQHEEEDPSGDQDTSHSRLLQNPSCSVLQSTVHPETGSGEPKGLSSSISPIHTNDTREETGKTKKSCTLEEENRLLKEARLCKICMDSEVGIVFLPCGHLATCVNCALNLATCPVCRQAIKATVRTFFS